MKQAGNMKKRFAAWMACAMAVAMACAALPATALATGTPAPGTSSAADAGNGSITIDNPKEGVTYYGHKIFDVTYTSSGDTKSYSYSIEGSSDWYSIINTYANKTGSGLTLAKTAGADAYVVSITEGTFSAADFAKHLSENAGTITPTFTLGPLADGAADTTLQKTNLELGYYFVKGSSGALCNLTTTDPSVTIHDKNDVPFEKEVAEDADDGTNPETDGVQVGQKLTYTITGMVPDTAGFETYIYKARDIMDKGLTFNKDVKVTIGGTEVTLATTTGDPTGNQIKYIDAGTYTYPAGHNPATKESGGGFELSLDVKDLTFNAPIVITYTATVNEDAVTVISENEAVLNYGNDDEDDMQSTPPQTVKTISSQINIDKYKKVADETDKTNKLPGAKFVLKKGSGANAAYYKGIFSAADPVELINVEWVASSDADGKSVIPADATVVTTDVNGAAAFEGVKNGTYQLVETEAPAGYNLLPDPVEVKVNAVLDADGNLMTGTDYTAMEVTAEVANSDGSFLPSTGGMGTTLFYVCGIALMLAAVVLLVIKKRADAEKK